jgi:uracil-DNA glycosylase family 4
LNNLNQFVEKIREKQGLTDEVPGFDPQNGNEDARILFVLEAPGAKAVKTGVISFDNPDQTARNLREQLNRAGIYRTEIVIWNIVPWYLGDGKKIRSAGVSDVKMGLDYLGDLVRMLKRLEFIVLVGGAARRAHVYLSHKVDIRILGCHHPSPKVVNNYPEMVEENILVFRTMKSTQPGHSAERKRPRAR